MTIVRLHSRALSESLTTPIHALEVPIFITTFSGLKWPFAIDITPDSSVHDLQTTLYIVRMIVFISQGTFITAVTTASKVCAPLLSSARRRIADMELLHVVRARYMTPRNRCLWAPQALRPPFVTTISSCGPTLHIHASPPARPRFLPGTPDLGQ